MASRVQRIAAPDLPNPAPEAALHPAPEPRVVLPRDTDLEYHELLELLRRDLQLDLSTDVLQGSQAALLHLGIARGKVTLTWSAAALSGTVTVKHGLPATPSSVIATSQNASSGITIPVPNVYGETATSFNINAETVGGGAFTGTQVLNWVAII